MKRIGTGWVVAFFIATVASPWSDGRGLRSEDQPAKRLEWDGPTRPLTEKTARTWIALHEAKIRPMADRTPLRRVLEEIRKATRGEAGWPEGIAFELPDVVLSEREITRDEPVRSPFAGRPEVSADVYLKYMLRQFGWERYVGEGVVVINGPLDDNLGYSTLSLQEAHSWRMLLGPVPKGLGPKATLDEVLSFTAESTVGLGPGGRGLIIGTCSVREVDLDEMVVVDREAQSFLELIRSALRNQKLDVHVLADGNVILTEEPIDRPMRSTFPDYRYSAEELNRLLTKSRSR